MEIHVNKLTYSRVFEATRIADGSVRLVRYLAETEKGKELVTMRKWSSYLSCDSYLLEVNKPTSRQIDVVIFISHTSANCWRTVSCTGKGVEIENYHTLGEVNAFLESLEK